MAGRIGMLMVRHGQTEWNAVRRWQGHRDSPLTELGRLEAEACADVLVGQDAAFTTVVTSSLGRSVSTAEILAERLGIAQVVTDDRLREAHAGAWEGLLIGEIESEYPGWLASGRRPPDFETHDAVVARAAEALRDHAASYDEPVLVVSHSGVIRRLTVALGDDEIRVPNLGGIWLSVGTEVGSAIGTHAPIDDLTRDLQLDRRFDGPAVSVVTDRHDPGHQAD